VKGVGVGRGACALLATQSSTKVYRSPRGTFASMTAEIAEGALLAVVPDPVVCFGRARYRQVQRFDLDARAGLIVVDWLSSGRWACGERWAFDEYESRTVVRVDGRLLLHDMLALRAADGDLAERLGDRHVLASILVLGGPVAEEAARLRAGVANRLSWDEPVLIAGSPVGASGSMFRMAGRSVEEVGRLIHHLLGFLPARLGDNPWTRKW